MQYVPVFSKGSANKNNMDFTNLITRLTGTGLYSLIEAFGSKDFGYDTTLKAARSIKDFHQKCMLPTNSKFYIDSSGYSFIKGDVARYDASKLIDCYHAYLDHQRDDFDYIFSLDLPLNLGSPLYNTKDNVYHFNKKSLSHSKKLLEEDPSLADKFLFIYQFRTKENYEIWSKIYEELQLNKVIKNWALGGMVGLKGRTKINFSPLIGLSFRCLYDYLNSTNPNKTFKIHFLGIYQRPERFHIAFLESLFNAYLENNAKTFFTYDSIHYIRQSQKKAPFDVFHLENGQLTSENYLNCPDHILRKVYTTEEIHNHIKDEIEKRKEGLPISNINSFSPLNVYTNLQLDRFFEHVIEKHSMIDIFTRCHTLQQVEHEFTNIFKNLSKQYPKIFTSQLVKAIKLNMQITFEFHRWHQLKGNFAALENLIDAFINIIGIKDLLK